MTQYVAGWNLAGYLPETEPETFDTLEDARAYLVDEVERWLDQDYAWDGRPYAHDPEASGESIIDATGDGWYGDVHLWVSVETAL